MAGHDRPNSDAMRSHGPFSFLHHTTRYTPAIITRKEPQRQQQQKQKEQEQTNQNRPPSQSPVSPGHLTPKTTVAEKTTNTKTEDENETATRIYHVWRSRDNRKGRHKAVVITTAAAGQGSKPHDGAGNEGQLKKLVLGLVRLVTQFPVWDVSFLVAVVFVLGSVVWCINGCFVWLPLVAPASEFPGETDQAAGILAFVGATVFEVGSVLMLLEAVNAERSDCFGWALEESLEDYGLRLRPRHEGCHHHHQNRRALLRGGAAQPGGLPEQKRGDGKTGTEKERRWLWWPTWQEVRTHYIKEIGFLASSVQLLAASIFWISGFTALPPIYNALSVPAMNGVYWVPQVVGGTGFIVSGLMFMAEVQDKWYKPAPKTLGWHVGFWNLIGGIGFTLCPAVGFGSQSSSALEYASGLSTFVGSWAFLVGSVAQWYESLDKYALSVEDSPSWLQVGEKAV